VAGANSYARRHLIIIGDFEHAAFRLRLGQANHRATTRSRVAALARGGAG